MNSYQNPLDDVKKFFRKKTILGQLIIINLVVFLLVGVINLFLWLFQVNNQPDSLGGISFVTYYLAVPASLESLIYRPWTIFTYMFLHESFMHIFFNMVVLYFSGRIFMEYLSEQRLLNTYIFGGLAGAVFYIVAFNIFPVFSTSLSYSVALGASASVLAILIAVATYVPEYSVQLILFGKLKLKYIALIIVAIDVLSITRGNSGGHIAHLGGAFWGFLYVTMMKRGSDFTINFAGMNFRRLFKYFTKPKRSDDFVNSSQYDRPLSDDEYNVRKNHHQERIDKILEKISKSGYNSLSKSEKELLFKSSKKN